MDVLHVSNLSLNASQSEIKELFSRHGIVDSVMIISEKKSDLTQSIAWICMDNSTKAIGTLNKAFFAGRQIRVQLMGLLCKSEKVLNRKHL